MSKIPMFLNKFTILASILGVGYNGDILTTPGLSGHMDIDGSEQGLPSGYTGYGIVYSVFSKFGNGFQLLVNAEVMYVRKHTSSVFYNWKQLAFVP